MRELRKHYPNPFAEGTEAAAGKPGAALEPELEPVNPFIDFEQGNSAAAVQKRLLPSRPFVCLLCQRQEGAHHAGPSTPRFSFLDALLHHIETAHADEGGTEALTEAEWASLREIDQVSYGKAIAPSGEGPTENGAASSRTANASGEAVAADGAKAAKAEPDDDKAPIAAQGPVGESSPYGAEAAMGAGSRGGSPEVAEGDLDAPRFSSLAGVAASQVSVHSRMAVEVVLLGIVRHIQYGVLPESIGGAEANKGGYTQVLQIILGVESPFSPTPAMDAEGRPEGGDPDGASARPDEGGRAASAKPAIPRSAVEGEEEEEEELVVVRCLNTCSTLPLTLLQQKLHVGCRAYVEGALKMNRHVDDISRRSHAYPYVRVIPPQGSILIL
ncbi:unnamed protein product [Phytomonas sp. Hart1]|nr:unnamed protein product [Phytomonas sp. Hart1]|eukprot:CCW70420.1 unnamed protein product [Phytomonas sp. isolate Hart1]